MPYQPNERIMHSIGEAVGREVGKCAENWAPFNSDHELHSVLLEEVTEYFDEMRKKPPERDPHAIYHELVQVAAVAIRGIYDLSTKQHREDMLRCGMPVTDDRDTFIGGHGNMEEWKRKYS